MPDAEKNQQQPSAGICSWLWHDDREDYKAVLLWCQTKLNTGLFHAASIGPSVDDVQVHSTIEGERIRSVSFLVRNTYTHSCRSATMGSRFAARIAGYIPKTIPMPTEITTDRPTLQAVTAVGI